VKEFVHQAWLDMIKLNTPTHELKKINFEDKQESLRNNQNEEDLFVQVSHGYEQLLEPFRSVE
jgi:hypothetical protein